MTSSTNIGETLVSVFDHALATTPRQRTLTDVLSAIRDGVVAAKIATIRAVHNDTVAATLASDLTQVRRILFDPAMQAEFDTARARFDQDPHDVANRMEIVDWLKKALPAAAFAGTFSKRGAKHLIQHSGLICIDLDDLSNPPATVAQIGADPAAVAAFVSPTGTGAKIVLRVPPTDARGHKQQTFPSVSRYLKQKYGVTADKACSDVIRLCYYSHDY